MKIRGKRKMNYESRIAALMVADEARAKNLIEYAALWQFIPTLEQLGKLHSVVRGEALSPPGLGPDFLLRIVPDKNFYNVFEEMGKEQEKQMSLFYAPWYTATPDLPGEESIVLGIDPFPSPVVQGELPDEFTWMQFSGKGNNHYYLGLIHASIPMDSAPFTEVFKNLSSDDIVDQVIDVFGAVLDAAFVFQDMKQLGDLLKKQDDVDVWMVSNTRGEAVLKVDKKAGPGNLADWDEKEKFPFLDDSLIPDVGEVMRKPFCKERLHTGKIN
jgi:hypothetical protein